MMMCAKRLLLLFIIMPLWSMAQQRAMFSQYMFNGLAVNPAYSSIDEAFNVTAVSRHQWVGFEGSPNTQTLALHSPIKESNTSMGLLIMRDQIAEVLTDNAFFGTMAQRVRIGEETFIALGVNAGLSHVQADYTRIQNGNGAGDDVFNDSRDMKASVGLGIMVFSQKFYAGISSPLFMELRGNRTTSTSFRPHYMVQGGYLADLSEGIKFKPNVLFKYVNGSPLQMDLNANFLLGETIWLGASWRSFDSVDFIAELQISPTIQFGYSYDFTTSGLATVQRGSHEIMLSFRLPIRGRNFPRCYF